MSDIRYMGIDEACNYLVEATNNIIHDFDMSLVLSEYKYLRDYGHEMPLTEGTFSEIIDKIESWSNSIKKWINDIYDKVIAWIQDKMEEFQRWWKRLGLKKTDAEAAKKWFTSKSDDNNYTDGTGNKEFTYSSFHSTGVLFVDAFKEGNSCLDAIKKDLTKDIGTRYTDINDETSGDGINKIVDDAMKDWKIFYTTDTEFKSDTYSDLLRKPNEGTLKDIEGKTPQFYITPQVYNAAFENIFEFTKAIVSPLDKQRREAVRKIEENIKLLKKGRTDDNREVQDKLIKKHKIEIKVLSKLCSKAISYFRDNYSTSAKVVKLVVSAYKTWQSKAEKKNNPQTEPEEEKEKENERSNGSSSSSVRSNGSSSSLVRSNGYSSSLVRSNGYSRRLLGPASTNQLPPINNESTLFLW